MVEGDERKPKIRPKIKRRATDLGEWRGIPKPAARWTLNRV
jgi:hypothetical protein